MQHCKIEVETICQKVRYFTLQVPLSQFIQLRCSVFLSDYFFFCVVNYTSFTKNWNSAIGFWARTTCNTVTKVIDSYLLCFCRAKIWKYIFSSNELVHVCWIFRWCVVNCFWSTFALIFFPPLQMHLNPGGRKDEQSCLCSSLHLTMILDVYKLSEGFTC